MWALLIGFALSSSIDNLGVGITYGIRGIRIPPWSNFVIAGIAFAFSIGGIAFGTWVGSIIPGILPIVVGSLLLTFIGLRIVLLAVPRRPSSSPMNETPPEAMAMRREKRRRADKLTMVLKNPEVVDFDRSQSISLAESVVLGMALSANAMTNGLGAGLLGVSPWTLSAITALGSFISIATGVYVGEKAAAVKVGPFTLGQFGTVISGIMLVIIAIFALWH